MSDPNFYAEANAAAGLLWWKDSTRLDAPHLQRLAESIPDSPEARAALIVADDEARELYEREWVAEQLGAVARESAEHALGAVRDALGARIDRARLMGDAVTVAVLESFDDSTAWGTLEDEATSTATGYPL